MKYYKCPNCEQIWNEYDLIYSEGNCLTDLEECGWEDELEEVMKYYFIGSVTGNHVKVILDGLSKLT